MSISLDYGHERFLVAELAQEKRKAKKRRQKENRRQRIEKMFQDFPNCFYCGVLLHKENRSLDHRMPRSRGGSTCPSNLVTACKECNQQKGNSIPVGTIMAEKDGFGFAKTWFPKRKVRIFWGD